MNARFREKSGKSTTLFPMRAAWKATKTTTGEIVTAGPAQDNSYLLLPRGDVIEAEQHKYVRMLVNDCNSW